MRDRGGTLTVNSKQLSSFEQIGHGLASNLLRIFVRDVDELPILVLRLVQRVRPYEPLSTKVRVQGVVGEGTRRGL